MRERLSPVARRALLEKLHDYRRTAWEDGYRAGHAKAKGEAESELHELRARADRIETRVDEVEQVQSEEIQIQLAGEIEDFLEDET